jgi:hypothetical protein
MQGNLHGAERLILWGFLLIKSNHMHKNIKIIIIAVIVLIAAGFYWFQWLPTQARKTCSQPSLRDDILKEANGGKYNSEQRRASIQDPNYLYEECLRIKGVRK